MSVYPGICSDPDCTTCQHLNGRSPTRCPRTTVYCEGCQRCVQGWSMESRPTKTLPSSVRRVRLVLGCGHGPQWHIMTLANLHLIALTRKGARA